MIGRTISLWRINRQRWGGDGGQTGRHYCLPTNLSVNIRLWWPICYLPVFFLTNICYILYVTKFVVKTTGTLSFSFKMYLPFESIFFPIQKPWGSHVAYQLMTFCSLNILLYNHSQFLYFFLQEVACHNVHLRQSNSIVCGCIITSCLLDICVLRPFLHTLRLQCQF